MMDTNTGNDSIVQPAITKDDITAISKLEAIHDSRSSFYGKATIDTDKWGGKILKSYDTPIMALYEGMPFLVGGNRFDDKQQVRILDTLPNVGGLSQTTSRHAKEFLSQFTNLGTNLSTKDWNKALAELTNERSMGVETLEKAGKGYELSVTIDKDYGDAFNVPIDMELVSPTPKAVALVLNKALTQLRESENPYHQVIASQYEHNIDHTLETFSKQFEQCINKTAEKDPDVKALVEQNQQREQAQEKEFSPSQQRGKEFMELKNNLQLFAINEYCESMYGKNPLSNAVNDMLSQSDPSAMDLGLCSDILNDMCKDDSSLQMFVAEKLNTMEIRNDAQVLALAHAFDENISENDFSNAAINLLKAGVVTPGQDKEMFDLDAFKEQLNEYLFWDAVSGKDNFKEVAEQVLSNRVLQNDLVDIRELAEKLIQYGGRNNEPEQEPNYTPSQQKIMEKINREANRSDKSQDMDR